MPDFSQRATGLEIMDDLHAGGPDLYQALRELDAINYLLGGNYVTLNAFDHLINSSHKRGEYDIADLGCGSGDMLKRIRSFLEKRKINARLTGVDANRNVVRYAHDHTPVYCKIEYVPLNIFGAEFQDMRFDIVTGTLFFHHFTDKQLIEFFKVMKDRVRIGIIINDIHRHWFAYYTIKWLTKIFSKSDMVKHDAPVSVLRAFRKSDLEGIMRQAGIVGYRIKWCWAFRWQVVVYTTGVEKP